MNIKFKNLFRKKVDTPQVNKPTTQYYDRTEIDQTNATYRMIIGQRSNGKTYSVLKTILEDYLTEGKRACYIRRYAEEITPKNIQLLFSQDKLIELIKELSDGHYNSTFYRANCFYLAYYSEEGECISKDKTPFCITRAVNTWETSKGQDAGEISTVCYDEFMTRTGYLKDEFVCFCNLLSSVIRDRTNVIIYMLANSVNKYCPYFEEMGLTDVDKMAQGEVRVYTYGTSDLKVAVEYCAQALATKKTSSKYFAFENARLDMIKNGAWEIKQYPRCPYPLYDEDVKYRFYIKWGDNLICGEIIQRKQDLFIFFRRQTKDLEIKPTTIYYSHDFTSSICHVCYLKDCPTRVHVLIKNLILKGSMCFSDNEVGEIVRNWLIEDNGLSIL